jgi:hypothetical protein
LTLEFSSVPARSAAAARQRLVLGGEQGGASRFMALGRADQPEPADLPAVGGDGRGGMRLAGAFGNGDGAAAAVATVKLSAV